MRPKVKRIFNPIVYAENKIQLGFDRDIFEIEDEDGDVKKLFTLMDGKNTVAQIAEEAQLAVEDVHEFISTLDECGIIEDVSADVQGLTAYALERNRVNLNFFSNFSSLSYSKYQIQKELMDSTVTILGLGGSSLLAASLAGIGVGKIIGLDFDKVERSNLNRQFMFNEDDIGTLKIDAVARKVKKLNKEVQVDTINQKITSVESAIAAIEPSDVVLDGIDQPAILSSRWVNAACVQLKKPYLQGGVSNNAIAWQKYEPGGACYDCFLIDSLRKDPEFETQLRTAYGEMFSDQNTSYAPNVAMLSGFMSNEVTRMLTGIQCEMLPGIIYEMDTRSLQMNPPIQWEKQYDCPTCGNSSRQDDHIHEICDLDELIAIAYRSNQESSHE